ncbi:hypothetical protein ACKKBF_B38500 [Auxenochlorella protothecoides x Auxenochlorella symbiontica]
MAGVQPRRAEDVARSKQYDYKANSNLVLTAEQRTTVGHEPDGSAETLWGNMRGKMGDKVQRSLPEGLAERKAKRDATAGDGAGAKRRRAPTAASVLEVETAGLYRPRTEETRMAYEALLSVVVDLLGGQEESVLQGAADEVLAVLKNDRLRDPERQKELGTLLDSPVSDERFALLVELGKRMKDWAPESAALAAGSGEAALDEEGVAVEFDDESDEDEGEELVDVLDDDEEEGGDAEDEAGGSRAGVRTGGVDVDAGEEERASGIPVQDIDGYWLQRRVAGALPALEPAAAQRTADELLEALAAPDAREAENRAVALLGFDAFGLIKELLRSRAAVVWCTRLARAQDDAERAALEARMGEGGEASAAVLRALRATRATPRERQEAAQRALREEARRLAKSGGEGAGGGEGSDDDDLNPGGAGRAGTNGKSGAAAAARKALDLEALAFPGGGRFNSARSTTLPPGSYRTVQKGYEEVHVPAPAAPAFAEGESLHAISSLPAWAQDGFRGMKELNRIQSRVLDAALFSGENMLVCAPTGAGKTNVAMLAMLHEIGLHRRPDGSIDTAAFKMIYVAPMKALVAEMVGNFAKRLEPYGVKVKELTGDMGLTGAEIAETQLIVVTPEKWDVVTRNAGERAYTQLVRLVIIDEIHLLHDDRGPVLESIVARNLRQVEATQTQTRLVGLSATLPNYEDVAAFLRVDPAKGLFYFDNSYRPCPLAQQYIGVTVKKPLQRFQAMNDITYTKVMEAAGKHQVLVFVHSRKETAKTAAHLKEEALRNDTLARLLRDDSASREILQTEAAGVKSAELRELLPYGFGIHHAGMTRADRTLVEDLFADGHIQVLVSTATLAWGVNLPAHTVIIKGTQIYNPAKGAWVELSPLDVMQMFGRAGRPQYDTYGEGIIITGHSELQFYLSLFNMQLPVESQYVATIPNNLNAEIVLSSVTNLNEAAAWLGYTYLYVRMLCSPGVYGVPLDAQASDPNLMERRLDLAHSAATLLDRHNLIKYDRRTGNFQPTDLGRIASRYYVSYTTIATFNEHLKPSMTEIELLRLFAAADEFKYMVVRQEEKLELAKLLDRVPIPIKEGLDEPAAKINALLQAHVSHLALEGLALSADMVQVVGSAGRLMRCLYEVCLRRGWAGLALKALGLTKAVAARMWGSQTPLRQFKGVPADIVARVERKELAWERWYDLSSQDIGELLRLPKMGKSVHRLIHQFPRYELAAQVNPISRSLLRVDLTLTADFQWDDALHGPSQQLLILVEDSDSEHILHHEMFVLKKAVADEDHLITFTLPISEPLPPQYFIRVVSDRWLGCESSLPVSFRRLILPAKYPPPTELLDLAPLPVTALRDAAAQAALYPRLTAFNPVQTQCFAALHSSDDNVLVAAPAGSGKTLCAELAILRMAAVAAGGGDAAPPARCVYVAPREDLVAARLADWAPRFGALGLSVARLVGDGPADAKTLERSNVVLATPEHWDALSRRWRQRRAVQAVSLYVFDELHLVGGTGGPVLEVVASRARYVGSVAPRAPRIVALAASLANAGDVGDWLGVRPACLFNFPPSVRPVPLEVHVQGFEVADLEARMAAMARPAYGAIAAHAPGAAPAVMFVPTRRHARRVALDLLAFAAADGRPAAFLHADRATLAPYLERVKDAALRHALEHGVAFVHEAQAEDERAVAQTLFDSGAVQVLVATAATAWGLTSVARLVVIQGTQAYDASGQGARDYAVTDLLQMLGRASRPGIDASGIAVLMCHAPRKEYYKKFLFEPLPVDSHLDAVLHDTLAAEVVTRTVTNKQDAVDYLTWTLYYRRLGANPNYYGMTGSSHRHISDHLSDLVERVLADLEASRVIAIEDDMDLEPLNLGMIAAHYYVAYTTIELMAASLGAKTKLAGLVEVLAAASEYDDVLVRPGEERAIERLLAHAPLALAAPRYTDPHTKVDALLQAHVSRAVLGADLAADAAAAVAAAPRLLQAMVDVLSSSGWLAPALAAMELGQMLTQARWARDSPLLQLPHFTPELVEAAKAAGVEGVFDLMEMEDAERRALLKLEEPQLAEVARWCNRYPDVAVTYELAEPDAIRAGESASLVVSLEREGEGEVTPVIAPLFPGKKEEAWWLVVGDTSSNSLLAIKRVALQRKSRVKLEFVAPAKAGPASLTLFFMCDSYLGCDQEFGLDFEVLPGDEEAEDAGEETAVPMDDDK